jgi:hypothetical protein
MFPPAKAIYTGNPVRELPASNPAARPNIVILGGGQGSRGLNAFVNEFLPSLSTRFVIHHVLGKDNKDQTLSLPPEVYHSYQFVDKEIPQLLSEASIVITRGGLSTLTELAYLAKPVIIIPLPHSHQEGNAQFFALHKAAQMVPQGSGPDLLRAIELLQTDNHLALQQGKKLQELFNPRATEDYVALIKQNIALAIEMKPVAFLSGIGGIGLSALARYFLHQNYKVIGSDLTRSTVTEGLEAQGVKIFYEQTKKNLPENVSLFVYSSALPANHEELVEAKRLHIPTYTYNEYLGLLSEKYQCVQHTVANNFLKCVLSHTDDFFHVASF